jgi:Fungal specific transcription factor domain
MEPCDWDHQEVDSATSSPPSSSFGNYVAAPTVGLTAHTREMRTIELRLFHHYITLFAPQLPRYGRIEINQLYSSDAPQLGFGYEAVLSALLALSACHYLSLAPQDQAMKRAARYYLDQSIREQSQLVSRLDKDTAEPAILASMLLFAIIKLRAAFVEEDEPYRLPFEFFHMPRGVEALHQKSLPFLPGSSPVLLVLVVRPAVIDADLLSGEYLPVTILQDSLELQQGLIAECSPDDITIYQDAISYLHGVYLALLREEDPEWTRYRLYAMPGTISQAFLGLLKREEPRAIAILARFLALTKLCDGPRYHQGVAEYEVQGIANLMPMEWQWSMKWPFQLLELDRLADCEL